jgi:hypothetical protein
MRHSWDIGGLVMPGYSRFDAGSLSPGVNSGDLEGGVMTTKLFTPLAVVAR